MEMTLGKDSITNFPLRKKKNVYKRIFEIDFLRGILIILMVVDHLAYDFGILAPSFFFLSGAPQWLEDLSGWCYEYWYFDWRINLRYAVIALFFILSGISAFLSRNSLKRGMLVFGFGALVSIVAYIISVSFETNMFIFFGIISCLGLSMIIYSLFRLFIIKTIGSIRLWKWVALFLAILFIGVGYWMRIEATSVAVNSENWWYLINGRLTPTLQSYQYISGHVFTPIIYDFETKFNIILGRFWYGVDWAGIFPYLGYAFFGGFIGELLYSKKRSLIFGKNAEKEHKVERALRPLTYIGSKTIYIYLFHQVALALVAFLVFFLFGVPLR